MPRSVRFYSALVLAFLVVAVAGRSVAQVASSTPVTQVAPPPLFEGLTKSPTSEPARNPMVARWLGVNPPPSCGTVAATTTLGIPSDPSHSGGNFSEVRCGAFVVDYTIAANTSPHVHFGGFGLGSPASSWGGVSVPSTQTECSTYHEEARFYTKPASGGTFQFRGIARFKGVWVTAGNQVASGSGCWLYAEDADSVFYHRKLNRSLSSYVLRVALEARRGASPTAVEIHATTAPHTHLSPLVAP